MVFQGKPTDLHAVWNYRLIDERQLSYTEMETWLAARVTQSQRRDWDDADPRHWVAESAEIRERIYPEPGAPLGSAYIFAMRPIIDTRLEQGGVRLAAYLNALFQIRPGQACGT